MSIFIQRIGLLWLYACILGMMLILPWTFGTIHQRSHLSLGVPLWTFNLYVCLHAYIHTNSLYLALLYLDWDVVVVLIHFYFLYILLDIGLVRVGHNCWHAIVKAKYPFSFSKTSQSWFQSCKTYCVMNLTNLLDIWLSLQIL